MILPIATLAVLLLAPREIPPAIHVAAVAIVQGVPVPLALAVHQQETGNVPEADGARDRVVSRGNVGRMQVRLATWCVPLGHPDRAECKRALQQRHHNIRAGVSILALCLQRWHDEGLAAVAGHYNAGHTLGPAGERYARGVAYKMRRMLRNPAAGRRW